METSTDLVELLSAAKPSGFGKVTPGIKSETRIRIHRFQGGSRSLAHEINLSELVSLSPSQRPVLRANDVIKVQVFEKKKFSFQTFTTIVGALSSVTILTLRLVSLGN